MKYSVLSLFLLNLICCSPKRTSVPIDRHALVTRHNVLLTRADTVGALSVGNGEFAFTVDASGLQTFSDDYANGIPPGTQSQWGWHSFPGERHSLDEVLQEFESCDGTKAPYAVQHNGGNAGDASRWLRTNPHRLQLGLTGLVLTKKDGERARLGDLKDLHQKLDLWTGEIETSYLVDGDSVKVELYGHQEEDAVSAKVTSALIDTGRLKLEFRFPYGDDCHTCAGYNWGAAGKHTTRIVSRSSNSVSLRRVLDSTVYYVDILWAGNAAFQSTDKPHRFELIPSGESDSFQFTVRYSRESTGSSIPDFLSTKTSSEVQWKNFWTSGGAIDFSDCLDPRAQELERRVVLSQYLTRIQCSGSLPPQETGLTMNSWYGKFHLEMHWWHGVHFALWGRPELLENSMQFYSRVKKKAEATAAMQGCKGARWQKMTDPYGDESPSGVGVFLIWQEPHPIYFAELLYRQHPTRETLEKYRDIVFSTADFMASFARLDKADGKYHLCHPLIPSQEIFKARETDDPTFELAYWHYGLSVAQQWRKRLDLAPDPQWQKVIDGLAGFPVKDGMYLPVATVPQSYEDDQYRRDHPSVVAALGVLPSTPAVDAAIMSRTFEEIMKRWKWETTWGWDYPMLAMTAARLGKPEQAIDALLMDVQKNTYLVNGHNYQDKRLRLYLPGNGGLLTAVAMMAAGWDGNKKAHPGFPDDGKWNVRWEGLSPMP
jgi:hypothetical protein